MHTVTAARMHRALGTAIIAASVLIGCNQPPAVHPWRDDSISPNVYGTPSSEGIAAQSTGPAIRQREVPETTAPQVRDETPHYPLWWEDPMEDKGDGDRQFAWTWQDYVGMPYGLGRFMLNTMGWPVSAVVTPPGTAMVSDGRVGRDHDATVGNSPDPTAGPEDFKPDANRAPASQPGGLTSASFLP